MPASFPEVWLKRVIITITSLVAAPWLDGIAELDVQVLEVGSGSASEMNVIHIPVDDFEVEVLLNNTTYPIAQQAHTDSEVLVQLDKYQTKVTTLSDDQIIGAAYNKIDSATAKHTGSILKNKFKKAIHALAPASNTASTPVLAATGAEVTPGGRRRATYEDLVAMKDKLDQMDCPTEGRRMVLSTDHYNDLLLDKDRFANLLVNHNAGTVAPIIAGFEIFSYLGNPYFTTAGAKVPYGAIPGATDTRASVCFLVGNVAKKTGLTKQYFAKSDQDPENQTNRLNYRHYFIAMPMRQKYMGAII